MSATELIANLERLGADFLAVIQPLDDEQAIRAAQAQFLGKKGKVSEVMKELSRLPPGDRPLVGAAVNKIKQTIEDRVTHKLGELANAAAKADLSRRVDITLPARPVGGRGRLHLLTQVRLEAVQIFSELGFVEADGPQIETDWHTFEALAIPKDHPARDMQDTFYVSEDIVLRTHTSPVQVRTMLTQPPPIRIIAPGHVYRRDDDPTHSPMFTQIEGLAVDEGLSFADLKGVLIHFVSRFFQRDLTVRLRPSYFPFVEPGVEIAVDCFACGGANPACPVCRGSGWLEIMGAGMVHPEILEGMGYDTERYTGFAAGMGVERIAMLKYGIEDIRNFYQNDLRFLSQF